MMRTKSVELKVKSNNIDVIIPSAILVPEELQNMGKLPGVIYPVNQKIVFDYLYAKYKDINGSIDIICYEEKEKVHRRLAAYDDTKIRVKDLNALEDLGHTLYFALEQKNGPVLINFADTIVMDSVLGVETDTIFYAEDYLSAMWTYFEVENGVITILSDKENVRSEEKKKLFVGLFMITDCQLFRKCLEDAFEADDWKTSTLYYALCRYSELKGFDVLKVCEWFDIGHADTYYKSKLEVKAREFNHIEIDKERGMLRKTSDNKEKFIGEILWYLKLPSDIEYVRPRIFSYSLDYADPYITMEYYAYHTVHELFLYGDLTYHQWKEIFDKIRFVYNDFKRYSMKDTMISAALEDMYLTKTLQRLDQIQKNEAFKTFFLRPVMINGVQYQALDKLRETIREIVPKMLYDVAAFHIIHGDLCFTNIMVDSNLSFIKVIDPRGKFGTYDIYGDTRYELAKLFHSVDGKYDYIIKDLFMLDYNLDTPEINYKIIGGNIDFDLYRLFLDAFKQEIGEDLKKIELIEALLFLSMIPLHGESLKHQLAMLGTGIEVLNRVVDITI